MNNHFYENRVEHFIGKLRGLKKSATIWFNSILASVVIALPLLQDTFTQLQPYLPDNFYKILAVVVIVGNLALRFKTTKDLADKV